MQRRRRKEDEHENHERWLVSYADFITLLFAFFVVMYAISSINEGKYRVLSDTLAEAFSNERKNEGVRDSAEPIQVGEVTRTSIDLLKGQHKVENTREGGGDGLLEGGQEQKKPLDQLGVLRQKSGIELRDLLHTPGVNVGGRKHHHKERKQERDEVGVGHQPALVVFVLLFIFARHAGLRARGRVSRPALRRYACRSRGSRQA